MKKITILVVIIIFAGALWYFLSPVFITKEVNEDFPEVSIPSDEEIAEMTEEERVEAEREIIEEMSDQPATVVSDDMPESSEPTLLLEGQFKDADSFHRGSGRAGIYELADGSRVLRFENFSVTNGPDLHVLLASGSSPEDRSSLGEYIDLGKLKGNQGNQNYEIPLDFDLNAAGSVVIYCDPFHVVFSTASFN